MTSQFNLTVESNTVAINSQGSGKITFTAFNASGRTARGRANMQTVPEGQPHLAWLTISGDAEREFPIAGVDQFLVQVNAPKNAAVGQYTFRLNLVEVANPDETFSEGPTVSFKISERKRDLSLFPWWILLALLAGIILIAGIIYLATRPRTVEVPNVIGLQVDDALSTLEAGSLRPRQGAEEFSANVSKGAVARTDPQAKTKVDKGSRVEWYPSLGAQPTPTPTATPMRLTATPTATPTPNLLASWTIYEDRIAAIRHPKDWLPMPCPMCVGFNDSGSSLLAVVSNKDLYGSLEYYFHGVLPEKVNYQAGAFFMAFVFQDNTLGFSSAFPTDWLKMFLMNSPSGYFPWHFFIFGPDGYGSFDNYVKIQEERSLNLSGYTAAQWLLEGEDRLSGQTLLIQVTAIVFGSRSERAYLIAAAPGDIFEKYQSTFTLLVENFKLK